MNKSIFTDKYQPDFDENISEMFNSDRARMGYSKEAGWVLFNGRLLDGFDLYLRTHETFGTSCAATFVQRGGLRALGKENPRGIFKLSFNFSSKATYEVTDICFYLFRIDLKELAEKIPQLKGYYDKVKDDKSYRIYEVVFCDLYGHLPWDDEYTGPVLLGDVFHPDESAVRKFILDTHFRGNEKYIPVIDSMTTKDLWRQLHFIDPEIAKAMLELKISSPAIN